MTPSDTASALNTGPTVEPAGPAAPRTHRIPWPLRKPLAHLLARVQHGSLTLELPGGERLSAQGPQPGPQAVLVLHRWRPLARLMLQGDLGVAESFIAGDWSTPDLTALLLFGARNESAWGQALEARGLAAWWTRLAHRLHANSRRGSRQNIAFHYDLGNPFYAQWLDASMLYSSALYTRDDETLEQAQATRLDHIRELVDAAPGARVLEIGCGWGELAATLAERCQAQVTGLTLSREQLAHALERVAGRGQQERVDLQLQDYRDVQGQYDRIVSIEMIEAVGEAYWPTYFETLRQRLAPGGHAVLQAITIDEAHFERYRSSADFIQRHVFPGGMLPSVEAMQRHAANAGLVLRTERRFGASYARTLVAWRERFEAAWPAIAAQGFDERFRRLWTYYLCYCEAGFLSGRIDVGLYSLRPTAPAHP